MTHHASRLAIRCCRSSRLSRSCHLISACLALLLPIPVTASPLRLHPDNPHYVEFRGELTPLVGSSEHYGALINLDFDYLRYLDETRACGLNLVRVFSGPYRELPGSFGIESNTLAPLAGRFVCPWARSTTPGASDGGNKYDLTKWDAAYFHRLRDFVKAAGERGIIVEITLFCPFYGVQGNPEFHWEASPMNAANHINGVGAGDKASVYQTGSDLLPYQKALARKTLTEVKNFDNVFIEVMNEPYQGGVPDAWQNLIIDELVDANPPHPLLIAQNIANNSTVISNPNPAVSIFNFHYALPDAALLNQGIDKVIGDDETGFDGHEDLSYRREAWQFMLAGGGLINHLDFHFTAGREDGIASPVSPGGGGPAIRRQLGFLHWFLKQLPLVGCAPEPGFVLEGAPPDQPAQVLAKPGEAYGLYLQGGDQTALVLDLPVGTYEGRWMDPRSGITSAEVPSFVHEGGAFTLTPPAYGEDVALLLFGGSAPPPRVTLTSPAYQTVTASDAALTLTAEASVTNGSIQRVEFLEGDKVLGASPAPPYQLTLPSPGKGRKIFRARVVTTDGRSNVSPPAKCIVSGPHQSGVNLNGPDVTLNGQLWLSEANAVTAGLVLTNAQGNSINAAQPLYPLPDTQTKALVTDQLVQSASQNLTVTYPVPNGTYDVFFSLIEGDADFNRDVRAFIEGQLVAKGIGELALGEWVNYGPYRTTVSDGTLDIGLKKDTKGEPKIANFSLYTAEPDTPLADARIGVTSGTGVAVLSLPAGIPAGQVEAAPNLDTDAEWLPVDVPASSFTERQEFVVPATETRRFFRLRRD